MPADFTARMRWTCCYDPSLAQVKHTFCCLLCSEDALDLLRRLLVFNPARRLSAEEALAHPYVAQFHAPADEPAAPGVITIPIDDNTKARIHIGISLGSTAAAPQPCAEGCGYLLKETCT